MGQFIAYDPEPPSCELLKTFLTRFGVLFLGAMCYVLYTLIRMRLGYDQRNFPEFAAMFINLASHQAVGGVLLLLYSLEQNDLDGLSWYSSTFDFEFVFTMFYIKFVKSCAAPVCLGWYYKCSGNKLFLGQVGDGEVKFRCDFFVVQWLVSVCVVGVGARLSSMSTISALQHLPENIIYDLASFYWHLDLPCSAKAVFVMYIKPGLVDALTFAISDMLLSSKKSRRNSEGIFEASTPKLQAPNAKETMLM
mmetsp:Transcript_14785/g.29717  ORF Transcript_14785/g.29717 Transcript_14785/m.29717 type:complete len:250 (-) Transcript_14785:310-1059(-)